MFKRLRRPSKEVLIRAIIFKEDERWTVQGLEFDIVARGANPHDASIAFRNMLLSWIDLDQELGREPFSALPPGPEKYWKMFEETRMIVEDQHKEHQSIRHIPSSIIATPELRLC